MKQLVLYVRGVAEFPPKWTPKLLWPKYVGDNHYLWFGIRIHAPKAVAGDSLFQAIRRKI